MLLAADGDYRKVGNGTTTRALRFVSILKSHHSSNRSHQGHGKGRKASGRSCLSAFATACTTAGRTSAGICATAASSRYAEASARCLSARSRRSGVRRTTLNESLMARQTVRCGLRALPSCAPINRDHAREHDRKSDFCFAIGNETGNPPRRGQVPIKYGRVACAKVAKRPNHKTGCVNRPADAFGIRHPTSALGFLPVKASHNLVSKSVARDCARGTPWPARRRLGSFVPARASRRAPGGPPSRSPRITKYRAPVEKDSSVSSL